MSSSTQLDSGTSDPGAIRTTRFKSTGITFFKVRGYAFFFGSLSQCVRACEMIFRVFAEHISGTTLTNSRPMLLTPSGGAMTYDYQSLTHYGGYDFALGKAVPTIIPRKPQVQQRQLGNREGHAPWDADKVDNMYKGICS